MIILYKDLDYEVVPRTLLQHEEKEWNVGDCVDGDARIAWCWSRFGEKGDTYAVFLESTIFAVLQYADHADGEHHLTRIRGIVREYGA